MAEDPTVSQYRAGYARGVEVERSRIREELAVFIAAHEFDDWRDRVAMQKALDCICSEKE